MCKELISGAPRCTSKYAPVSVKEKTPYETKSLSIIGYFSKEQSRYTPRIGKTTRECFFLKKGEIPIISDTHIAHRCSIIPPKGGRGWERTREWRKKKKKKKKKNHGSGDNEWIV